MQPVWRPDEVMIHDTVEHSLSHIISQFSEPLSHIRGDWLTGYYDNDWHSREWQQPGSDVRLDTHPLPAEHAQFCVEHMGRDVDIEKWRRWQTDNLPHWQTESEFAHWRLKHG